MIDCGGRHQIHVCLYVLSVSQIQQNTAAVYGNFDGLGSISGDLHDISATGIRFKIAVSLLRCIFGFGVYRIQVACQVLNIYDVLLIQCRVTVRIQCYYHIIDAGSRLLIPEGILPDTIFCCAVSVHIQRDISLHIVSEISGRDRLIGVCHLLQCMCLELLHDILCDGRGMHGVAGLGIGSGRSHKAVQKRHNDDRQDHDGNQQFNQRKAFVIQLSSLRVLLHVSRPSCF